LLFFNRSHKSAMERLQDIDDRHERELAELREKAKAALKGAKKSEKAQVEATYIQMEFDLKAQHREEIDEYEEKHGGKVNPNSLNYQSNSNVFIVFVRW